MLTFKGSIDQRLTSAVVVGALVLALSTGTVSAQSTASTDPSGAQAQSHVNAEGLEEIIVTGRYQFLSANTQGATNLPLPIEQVPQSIGLVSADFIQAANLKTLGDIASYTPGAVNAGNPENNGSVIFIRGFTAGRAIDGINAISTYTSYEPDFAVVDRLEVVEGPSSVVYGVSSPGGLVNYVTKGATAVTPTYLYAQVGSWDNYRLEGQIAHPVDSQGRVRLIGIAAQDSGDSFVNGLHHDKTTLYGGIDADISDSVTAFLHGGYEWYSRPAFDGIPTEADGTPAPVSRSLFLGSKDIKLDTSAYYLSGNVTWKPNAVLELALRSNYEDASMSGGNSYAYGLEEDGDVSFSVTKFDEAHTRNYGIGASSIIHFDTLGLEDSFVALSAIYQDSHQATNVRFPPDSGTVNIFASQHAITQAFNELYAGELPYFFAEQIDTKTTTFSAQSVTRFFDRLSLLLGASYSKPKIHTHDNFTGDQDYDISGQTSWRAGLTYEFLPGANAYFSYSESFSPQPLLAVDRTVLPPLSGEQYEAGVKYRMDEHLLLTGAIYQIVERNLAAYDQSVDGFDYYKPLGEVTHKGFELKALGEFSPNWQINAGYAYLDPKITRDADPAAVDQTQLFLPKNTFSLYTTYLLQDGALKGFSFGGGARYVDAVETSYDGSTKQIPDYTVVDANIAYDFGPWTAQVIIGNLFDEKYFINNYQTLFYGNVSGTPRSFTLSVRRTF